MSRISLRLCTGNLSVRHFLLYAHCLLDLTKFFGCELGAQIHVDEKNERYIVNGAHEATKLQELLDGFIKKFVLCQGCGNPETVMVCTIF